MSDNMLGKGRAAVVYRSKSRVGRPTARKIFVGSLLAKLVNLVLLGADNPYTWNRAAVREAVCRRRILAHLALWWLPEDVRVAEVLEVAWNGEHQVNEMTMELIDGRGACLHHPFSAEREWEYRDLVDNVMTPLQRHLIEAGFDGLVWQAGLGNPVAASNFLLSDQANGERMWVWVDLESGVPAAVPLSPVALFRFYLPHALRYGRPVFDDVNLGRLQGYIEKHKAVLVDELGAAAFDDLQRELAKLSKIKGGWRAMGRLERSIQARLCRGAITSEQAAWYRRHPVRWYGREILHGISALASRGFKLLAAWFAPALLRLLATNTRMFLMSAAFRTEFARRYVGSRIEKWRGRGQLGDSEAKYLKGELYGDESSLYIADIGIHIAIKPVVKAVTWLLLPALYGAGVINEVFLVTGVVVSGAIGRTLYTVPRTIAALARGAPAPWVALIVGLLPVVGNLAFPLQLLYAGSVRGGSIAKFLVYDILALIGSGVPIWGCQDSLLEHWSNHLGDLFVRTRLPLNRGRAQLSAP